MRVSPSTNLVPTINGREEEEVKSFTYLGSQEGKWGLHGVVPSLEE